MSSTRCIHGLDSRFCAVCNRTTRKPAATEPDPNLTEILAFLNDVKKRATYKAVASVLGVPSRSMGKRLGDRRPDASWVVNADTGLPTDYEQADWHPDLLASPDVIKTGSALSLELALWRKKEK